MSRYKKVKPNHMKANKFIWLLLLGVFSISGCTTINKTMREPNVVVKLVRDNFTLSDQVTAEATSTTILGVDWNRLKLNKTGNIDNGAGAFSLASIPVIGDICVDKTANNALHELMEKNPGYDVVMYPQYDTKTVKPAGIGFFYKITTVKVTARLGKLK
jgi:hypothetical protein